MNEYETRSEHITPALKAVGWGVVEGSKIEYEYQMTNCQIIGAARIGLPAKKLAALDALKKSLLHHAFSGRLTGGEKATQPVGRRDACGV